jgi:hypothetical protein
MELRQEDSVSSYLSHNAAGTGTMIIIVSRGHTVFRERNNAASTCVVIQCRRGGLTVSNNSSSKSVEAPTGRDSPFPPANFPYFGEYDENGVDLSLLRYMLSLTPRERILRMQRFASETLQLMEHGRRHREAKVPAND